MLTQLAQFAEKKEQVSVTLAKGTDAYLLGIAPKGAGNDKLAPLVLKGTVEEISKQLDEKLPGYIETCTKKPEPPKKKAAPEKKPDATADAKAEQPAAKVSQKTETLPQKAAEQPAGKADKQAEFDFSF